MTTAAVRPPVDRPGSGSRALSCTHCGLPVPAGRAAGRTEGDVVFCCEGCRAVYGVITGCSLERYYAMRKRSVPFGAAAPASPGGRGYGYLDDPAVRARSAGSADGRTASFYIEGLHCVACLWLLERLGTLVPGVERAKLDLGARLLRVTLSADGSFAAAAEGIDRLGYKPHPLFESRDAGSLRRRENRGDLVRIGVAAFCAMNIMFLFVAVYGGAGGVLKSAFLWISAALYLPVAFFAAVPFYRGAWSSLRNRRLDIDLPVAVAMILGSVSGYVQLAAGSDQVYFDSIASFVFLLLSARFLLKEVHQKAVSYRGFGEFLVPQSAMKTDPSGKEAREVMCTDLRASDLVRVRHGETIPVDGEAVEGGGHADVSMLTGESEPVPLAAGSPVFAGTVNAGTDLTVRVHCAGNDTRVGRLLRSCLSETRAPAVRAADRAAQIYVCAILAAVAWLFVSGAGAGYGRNLERALAMVIIACPCALALVTPLAYRLAAGRCASAGILLKNAAALEKLPASHHLFLDKTGTVTHGKFEVLEWTVVSGESALAAEALALEGLSAHPISYAIRGHARDMLGREEPPSLRVTQLRETVGLGVSGTIGEDRYEIRGIDDPRQMPEGAGARKSLGIFKNGALAVRIGLGDRLRGESASATGRLMRQFRKLTLVTGDAKGPSEDVARRLGVADVVWGAGPEDKKRLVERTPRAVIVGDGANDAAAMASAWVSVAVQGSIEVSLQNADVYLTSPGIGTVSDLMDIARRTRTAIRAALAVSFLYNAVGVWLAISGHVGPLLAAVAMPVSSVTVLAVCYWTVCGTGKGAAWK